MNFCWVTLHVKDLEKSLSFYHEMLELPIDSRHSGNGTEMVMLGEKDAPKIELIQIDGRPIDDAGSGISVGITVNSIQEALELVEKNGIPVDRGPVSPNPGVSFFFITDPDGFTVQLVERR